MVESLSALSVYRSLFWPLAVVAGVLLVALLVAWWVHVRMARASRRRQAARRLIDNVKAYAAWVECQIAEPFAEQPPDGELPEPLRTAVDLKDREFPELAPAVLRLLRTHAAMTSTLWQHHLLRITHVEAHDSVYADPRYQRVRDEQDGAIDALIAECRALVGEMPPQWHRTRSDFGFTSGLSLPSHPGSRS